MPKTDPRCFTYGHTATPDSTLDSYLPLAWDRPILPRRGADEPMRFPAVKHTGYLCRREKSSWIERGHRRGAKGVTLRDHRKGA